MTAADQYLDTIQARLDAKLPDDARMDAYYYGFERTGVASVDAILSAVAIAGKGAHHTESWGDDSEFGYYKNRPGLPDAESAVDLIQSAADLAARNTREDMAKLLNAVKAVESALDDLEARAERIYERFDRDGNGSISSTRNAGRGTGIAEAVADVRATLDVHLAGGTV